MYLLGGGLGGEKFNTSMRVGGGIYTGLCCLRFKKYMFRYPLLHKEKQKKIPHK